MKEAIDHICPRCGGDVPNTEHKGKYSGALSRTDNDTEICSSCGTAEAMEQFENAGALTSQDNWPV